MSDTLGLSVSLAKHTDGNVGYDVIARALDLHECVMCACVEKCNKKGGNGIFTGGKRSDSRKDKRKRNLGQARE